MLTKIKRIMTSRLFIFAIIILLQLAMITSLVLTLSQRGAMVYSVMTIISLVIALALFSSDLNPAYKMIWGLLIVFLPIIGSFYFLLWHRIKLPKKMRRTLLNIHKATKELNPQDPKALADLEAQLPDAARQVSQLSVTAQAPVYPNYNAAYFPSGEEWFADLLPALEKAEEFIFMEFFIINHGKMLERVLEVLERKAKAGVEIKFLYDDIGTILLLPHSFLNELRSRGIEAKLFNPMRPWLYGFVNSRDHRKIVVIDGKVGYTGGCNLADEYINEEHPYGYWKDTMVRIEGPAVWSLSLMFLRSWSMDLGPEQVGQVDYLRYKKDWPALPAGSFRQPGAADGFVQPYGSTPLANTTPAENAYLQLINRANDYIYITTPYLILDNELAYALCLAASSGVDVRLITPGIPDKKMVFMLTQSYYGQLIRHGVKIYEFEPGFVHAKMFVSDDRKAIVGTANLDFRSLYLHFECCAEFYQSSIALEVRDDFLKTQALCREITRQDLAETSGAKRLIQSLLRFIAPLM